MPDPTTDHPVDDLRAVLDAVRAWLDERDVVAAEDVLFLRKSMPSALWGGDDWLGFLASAVKVGSWLVWIEVERCVLADEAERSDLLSVGDERADDLERLLSTLSGYEGRIAALYLHWAYAGVLNSLILESAWIEDYHDYQDLADELRREAESRSAAAERAEARQRDQQAVNEMAQELLAHPRYEACKNRNDREYLARQLFDTELSISSIVLQAETMDRMGGEPGRAGDEDPLPF
jgi:hypothetical protein